MLSLVLVVLGCLLLLYLLLVLLWEVGRVLSRSCCVWSLLLLLLLRLLLGIVVCLVEWLLVLIVTVECLTFSPAAVDHTSKMHSHVEVTGSATVGWFCVMGGRDGGARSRG